MALPDLTVVLYLMSSLVLLSLDINRSEMVDLHYTLLFIPDSNVTVDRQGNIFKGHAYRSVFDRKVETRKAGRDLAGLCIT